MKHRYSIKHGIVLILLWTLLFPSVHAVLAQDSQIVTATGNFHYPDYSGSADVPITFYFLPSGGEVTGTGEFYVSGTEEDGSFVSVDINLDFKGTYAGGDGGEVSGTISGVAIITGYPNINYSGTWSGNFYANGSGNGGGNITVTASGYDESASGEIDWEVSFSPEEFASKLEPPVTIEDIYKTYGIQLVSGTSSTGTKEWSPHELKLMKDLLDELPREMLSKMALTSIARSEQYIKNNKPDPSTFGVYYSSTSTIHVFDLATHPFDFSDDPNGDKEFKGTILHEMIHALQYKKDEYSNYDNLYKSPLVQSYMDTTTPLNAVDTGIWENGWTYFEKRGKSGWKLYGNDSDKSPTDYGSTSPSEDMSESVMMYVYDPQKLKDSSPLRYDFIRDQIFEGVEYDNGIRKTP